MHVVALLPVLNRGGSGPFLPRNCATELNRDCMCVAKSMLLGEGGPRVACRREDSITEKRHLGQDWRAGGCSGSKSTTARFASLQVV